MKKFTRLFIVIMLFITVLIIGCKKDTGNTTKLHIFSLNDFHGALYEDDNTAGIVKIGNYIQTQKKSYETLVLSAGDMFQGTAVSSMTRGRAVIDMMNIIGFDAMAIGNHEFDWGIEEILKYNDLDTENGEADFKFLSANIHNIATDTLASWAVPYQTFIRNGIKIGVIGVIGSDQTSDILASHVEDYEFTNELAAIKKYTKILRTDEQCDAVVVLTHFDSDSINYELSNSSDDEYVDAVINGHTHNYYSGEISYGRDIPLTYIQSGSSGRFLGKTILEFDNTTKKVISVSVENIDTKKECKKGSSKLSKVLDQYKDEYKASLEELAVAGETISRDMGAHWAANVIYRQSNADLGMINFGGIRKDAFPIASGSTVKYGDVFRIMPFENEVRLVSLTGAQILSIMNADEIRVSGNINSANKTINQVPIDVNKLYRVATIDYLFEKSEYPFKTGADPVKTGIVFRELMAKDVKDQKAEYGKFYATK